ncbi:hypothetical protein [Fictibacillus sp. KU28468]|nr:hypothetical protein [Fictibacillus sp. KU28468]UZJ79652.1 hypothetical protein OKX00_03990 [Fictibacillus sp. KU28468]
MISVSGCSLSAGRALNPSAQAPAGFTCHARPAESRTFHSNQLVN